MLLELKNIKKYFRVRSKGFGFRAEFVRAVDDVNLAIASGENLGLVGESGSGKTTLGRIALKLIQPDSGQIIFEGKDLTLWSASRLRAVRKGFQMVFQDPYSSLDPRYTVNNLIQEAMLFDAGKSRAQKEERVRELLLAVNLPVDVVSRFPHEFSGGERQRISIARALAMNPKLLILDEAVSSLDVLIQEQILELLKELQRQFSLTYLFISHNLRAVKKICARVAVMYKGKIVELGPADEIFSNPLHPYTKELLAAALEYKTFPGRQEVKLDENLDFVDCGNRHFVLK